MTACLNSSQPGALIDSNRAGPWPVAISTKESLVEVSPSTVMQLKDSSAASLTSRSSIGWLIAASVATKPSMVAMFGRIMPAPLAMPVIVAAVAPAPTLREAALATVSVVMMAWAASCQPSVFSADRQAGRPALRRSTGNGSMITPVEKGNT